MSYLIKMIYWFFLSGALVHGIEGIWGWVAALPCLWISHYYFYRLYKHLKQQRS